MAKFFVWALLISLLQFSCQQKRTDDCFDVTKYVLIYTDPKTKVETYRHSGNNQCLYHKMYWPNGTLLSTFFAINGKREGVANAYNSKTGKIMLRMHYVNGLLDGAVIRYKENGQIKDCDEYKKGRIIGSNCPPE